MIRSFASGCRSDLAGSTSRFASLRRSLRRRLAAVGRVALSVASVAALSLSATAQDQPEIPALTPAVQNGDWWMPRHEQKLAEKEQAEKIDLVWIGDSITHGWEGTGKKIWDEKFAPRHSLNLGYSGDRTEQVLWRLQHGEVEGIAPKGVVIMIGTNNTGHRQDPADQTAAGVRAIVAELRQRLPEAKILVLAIFPRGETTDDPLRRLNTDINALLAEMATEDDGDGGMISFLDINASFLADDGTLPKSIMPDLLHPNEAGYQKWAEAIEPAIVKLLGE